MDSAVISSIMGKTGRVVELQSQLTAFAALGPENGGQGEVAKASYVESILQGCERFSAPDDRVESGARPNLVYHRKGKTSRTLWLFGHLDVVPAGDLSLWSGDPWVVRREGDWLYGRGVEDNQQAMVSMIILAESLGDAAPELGLGLVFMADEECGSRYGLEWLLENHGHLFGKEDFYIIPDGGSPDGSLVEIAEKGQLWLRFTVTGSQCHASTPEKGVNSFLAASWLALALAKLNEKFPQKNPLFEPPCSTFAPTRHDANVDAVNIIPGKDVFYMDCRLLPELKPQEVLKEAHQLLGEVEKLYGVSAKVEIVQNQPAEETVLPAPAFSALARAITAVYGVKARPVGIGGATVAAFLRRKDLPALVWSHIENTCHQPDERSSISATLRDAAVFARILMDNPDAGF